MKKLEKVQVWAGGDPAKMILAAHEPGVEPKLLELACLRGAKVDLLHCAQGLGRFRAVDLESSA